MRWFPAHHRDHLAIHKIIQKLNLLRSFKYYTKRLRHICIDTDTSVDRLNKNYIVWPMIMTYYVTSSSPLIVIIVIARLVSNVEQTNHNMISRPSRIMHDLSALLHRSNNSMISNSDHVKINSISLLILLSIPNSLHFALRETSWQYADIVTEICIFNLSIFNKGTSLLII